MKLVSIFFTVIESIFVFCCLASNKQIREKYKVYLKTFQNLQNAQILPILHKISLYYT